MYNFFVLIIRIHFIFEKQSHFKFPNIWRASAKIITNNSWAKLLD